MYAIIDTETSGGKFNEEGITEIAIYKFDGHKVVDQFISLVNPMKPIDPYVVNLTGINNKMLRRAPRFHEIAKRIVEITEGCTIVAHNAEFDCRILRQEFARLGYEYARKNLCTVELSKKLLPDAPSYNLEKICQWLGIPLTNRHRAFGDALATVDLFRLLLEKDTSKDIVQSTIQQTDRRTPLERKLLKILDSLRNVMGVFYFHDPKGNIIYIGSSKNIYKHVNQMFISEKPFFQKLKNKVSTVTWEKTGSELISILKEEQEILQARPPHNKKPRESIYPWGLYYRKNEQGYLCFHLERAKADDPDMLTAFQNVTRAKETIGQWQAEFALNPQLIEYAVYKKERKRGLPKNFPTPEQYNERISGLLSRLISYRNMVIPDKGRKTGEKSVLLVRDGRLCGYGYCHLNHQINNAGILSNIITPITGSINALYIIHDFLFRGRLQAIPLAQREDLQQELLDADDISIE